MLLLNFEWFSCIAVPEDNLIAPEQPDTVRRIIVKNYETCPQRIFLFTCGLHFIIYREGSIIHMFPFYFMGWIQLGISSQSSSCVRSTTGHVMKCPWIQKMRSRSDMLVSYEESELKTYDTKYCFQSLLVVLIRTL